MKVLIFAPNLYLLKNIVLKGFSKNGFNVYQFDFRASFNAILELLNTQIFRFPFYVREKWNNLYDKKVNKVMIDEFDKVSPDIVFIYNHENLLPETLLYFKGNNSKTIFFLGDSPYYLPHNKNILSILFHGDLIIVPDTFWLEQLKLLGLKKVVTDFPLFDDDLINGNILTSKYYSSENTFDLVFVGTGYRDVWGYKRALFMSKFSDFNLKIYGNKMWLRWFKVFPELQKKFVLLKDRLPFEQLKLICGNSKLYPIDMNPGLINGIHLRVFEAIGMGTLPIPEYRRDIELFFNGVEIPVVKDYGEVSKIVSFYLNNENKREQTLKALQAFCLEKYKPEVVIKRCIEML